MFFIAFRGLFLYQTHVRLTKTSAHWAVRLNANIGVDTGCSTPMKVFFLMFLQTADRLYIIMYSPYGFHVAGDCRQAFKSGKWRSSM